jgi:biopolymer transport protein ExbD
MKAKRIKRRRFAMPEITLTPLIDTALTLLVIFIVTAPMVQHGIKVDLPQGRSKEVSATQELIITLNKDGKLYFNSYPVELSNLIQTVQQALEGRPETPVYVRADESVAYGKVIEIVDSLKQAGVKYVAMSTRPAQ